MLSKEEIEKAKKTLYPLSIGDFITWFTTDGVIDVELAIEILFKYINQLESNHQKLIEKLEKVLKEYEHILASEESAISLYSEIRNIVKGEKE